MNVSLSVRADGSPIHRIFPESSGKEASPAERRVEEPFAPLFGRATASRYCAWRGASDHRYVTSVYPADHVAADAGLPDFEAFVLLAVAQGAAGRRILAASAIERPSDRYAAIAGGLAEGVCEWHVHVLAGDRRARAVVAADLAARHLGQDAARCA